MPEDTQQAQNPAQMQDSQLPSDNKNEEGIEPGKANSEGLPGEVKERTKHEFEKLTTSNKELVQQLREERARREYYEVILNTPKPQQEKDKIIDPETGLPNEQVLTDVQQRTLEAQQRAERAEKQVQTFLQEQENRQVYLQYPELNPDSQSFDKNLHLLTKSIALQSMVNPQDFGGRQLSFMEAASEASKMRGTPKKEDIDNAIKSQTSKEQASLEAQGGNRRSVIDYDDLRRRSRVPGEEGQRTRIERFNRLVKSQE